jgi:P27 family predicted phage terminase small subunit
MSQPAKTIRQHLLDGTVPQGKLPQPSPFKGGRPKFPKHLSPVAKAEFKRCVQLLEERGTVTPGDYATLAVYSEVFARWVQSKREIGDELMVTTTITDNNGTARTVTRLNPLLKVAQNCESRMLSLVKELGLTPVSREKAKPTSLNEQEHEAQPGTVAYMVLQGSKK